MPKKPDKTKGRQPRRTDSSREFDISDKKDLVFHTYDMFLTAQTRLFTLSRFVYDLKSYELDEMQTMLFLDDIVQFAIASRRLVELTNLKSFGNQTAVLLQYFDFRESPTKMCPSASKIGFLTIINNLIHAKYIELFRHRYEYRQYVKELRELDMYHLYTILAKISDEDRWAEYAISPTVLFHSDRGKIGMITVKDLIAASEVVREKVVEICSRSKIFLEVEYRKG